MKKAIKNIVWAIFGGILLIIITISVWLFWQQYQEKKAYRYLNEIIIKLEHYKKVNNKYPNSIDSIQAIIGDVPKNLKEDDYFTTNGKIYRLRNYNFGVILSWNIYISEKHKWEFWDAPTGTNPYDVIKYKIKGD